MSTNADSNEQNLLMHPKVVDLCELASGSPYPPSAYAFVQEGLRFTVEQVFGDPDEAREERGDTHVTGRQLSAGLCEFAVQQYGMMARRVLEHWNIHRTDDFGRIVFRMIDAGLMSRQDDDAMEDFFCVYSFDEVFTRDNIRRAMESNSPALFEMASVRSS